MEARPGTSWRAHLPATGGYGALTAAFLWPAVAHMGDRVLSAGGDGSTFLWSYWAMPRAALDGRDPFVTDQLFHPVGANLAFSTTTPLEQVLTWPVTRLFGPGVAVNLLQLAALFLSALGAYLLAHHVCGDRRAAFVAGAAFALVPYRFVHLGGHFNLIHAEFLPFGLLALLRLLEAPSRRRAAALGAVVGLSFLTDGYLAVFLLVGCAVLVAARRRRVGRGELRALAGAGAVALVVAMPLLVVMLRAVAQGELEPLAGWGGSDLYSADLVSWFAPPATHPWWGAAVAHLRAGLPAGGEGLAYPGLLVLALAVAGRELGVRAARKGWVALAVVAGLLAMGPFLQLGGRAGGPFHLMGRSFAVPLPYLVFRWVPVLGEVRVPGRFCILAALALDVLAAVTLAAVMRRVGARSRRASAVAALALAVVVAELLPGGLSTHPAAAPAPYRAIAADPGPGAVLEVPLQWQSGTDVVGDSDPPRDDTIFLYWATEHRRPLVSGYVSRYPDERLDRLRAVPVYRQVLALMGEPGFDDPPTFGPGDLRALGIGFVVYHRDRPFPAALSYLATLGLDPLADDGTVVAWKVPA